MYAEAREFFEWQLREAPQDDMATRERVAKDHSDTLKNLRRIAETLYQDQIEQERQQLRWAQGATVDREWSEGLVRQQKGILEAILEQVNRAKRANSGANSFQIAASNQGTQQPQSTPEERPASELDDEHIRFSWIPNRNHVPLSSSHTAGDSVTGKPSAAGGHEQRYPGTTSPLAMNWPGRPYPGGSSNIQTRSTGAGPKAVPEFWKPPLSPEDAV
jgi:hypothetical protein